MAFGYEFVTLDDDQKHARRLLLDWYPLVAQLSSLIIFAAFQLCFFVLWLIKYGTGYERPRSPSFSKRLDDPWTWFRKSTQAWERLMWWMKKDAIANWGSRAEWIGGGIWTIWLLSLCIVDTDYLHLTKRFGAIGASQLPLHYLLAMRAPHSPIQWLTRLSHEQLKGSHQVLGRIVFLLFALHAILYLNFFILAGVIAKRIKDTDVILGIVGIVLFAAISTTALGQLRRWNYRVFYVSHVVIANIIILPLYFHVHHIRLYLWEVVIVNTLHIIFRFQRLKTFPGTIKLLPGTNLVEVRIPLSSMSSKLTWQPGQHVYLSRPTGTAQSTSIMGLLALQAETNPFTIASIPVKDKDLLLVARVLEGSTKKLAKLARSLSSEGDAASWTDIPLTIEGPYGSATHLPDFSTFDKVLLVAGGVGATFIVPIYRNILETHDPDHAGHPQLRFIWAVQKLADTQWAFPLHAADAGPEAESDSDESRNVEVYVTRGSGAPVHANETDEDIELAESDQLLSMEEEMNRPRKGMVLQAGRPKLSAIVDETFSKGSRVAVVACGPTKLTKQLSKSVEQWVSQGHEVFYHEETFGW